MVKRQRGASATTVIGGAMAGFEEQVFKSLPRIEELVRRGQDVRGLAADGSGLSVGFPPGLVAEEVVTPAIPGDPGEPPEPTDAHRLPQPTDAAKPRPSR